MTFTGHESAVSLFALKSFSSRSSSCQPSSRFLPSLMSDFPSEFISQNSGETASQAAHPMQLGLSCCSIYLPAFSCTCCVSSIFSWFLALYLNFFGCQKHYALKYVACF